jgi:hypothetical protein
LHDLTDQDLEKIAVASLGRWLQLLRALAELEGAPDPEYVNAQSQQIRKVSPSGCG